MILAKGEEFAVAFAGIFATVFVLRSLISGHHKRREHRLRILEQALQSGAVDGQIKQLLIAELTRPGPLGRAFGAIGGLFAGGKLLVVAGWLGVFGGAAMLLSSERDAQEMGLPVALMSFAVLTVPFALRELESRRRASPRGP